MRGSRRVSLEHNFSGSEGESSRDRVPMGCQVVFSRWNDSHPGFRGPTPGGFRRSARNVGACCRAPLLPALQTRSYGSTSGETIPEKFSSFHFLLHIVSKQNRGVRDRLIGDNYSEIRFEKRVQNQPESRQHGNLSEDRRS